MPKRGRRRHASPLTYDGRLRVVGRRALFGAATSSGSCEAVFGARFGARGHARRAALVAPNPRGSGRLPIVVPEHATQAFTARDPALAEAAERARAIGAGPDSELGRAIAGLRQALEGD